MIGFNGVKTLFLIVLLSGLLLVIGQMLGACWDWPSPACWSSR